MHYVFCKLSHVMCLLETLMLLLCLYSVLFYIPCDSAYFNYIITTITLHSVMPVPLKLKGTEAKIVDK